MRGWTEDEVERALVERPVLGTDELLILWSQRSREHIVEMLALDQQASLTLIAISSERSTPEVIGQVLESLWSYSDITLQELADDYRQARPPGVPPLTEAFLQRFGLPLAAIAEKPRVVILAPKFDAHTTLGVRYLERRGVEIGLVQATLESEGMTFTACALQPLVHSQKMHRGDFGIGRGRLFCVLQPGNPAVLWEIGRQAGDTIALVPAHALSAAALRFGARILAPVEPPATVELAQSGALWRRREDPAWTAREIGRVTARVSGRRTRLMVAALCRDSALQEFRAYAERDFTSAWSGPEDAEDVDWAALLTSRDRETAAPALEHDLGNGESSGGAEPPALNALTAES